MDILCPKCGEPWDFDSIHERVAELHPTLGPNDKLGYIDGKYSQTEYDRYYRPVASDFRTRGCVALGSTCNTACECGHTRACHEYGQQKPACAECECVAFIDTGTAGGSVDKVFGLTRTQAASTLYELLGDDMDGAAAMLEDMGF